MMRRARGTGLLVQGTVVAVAAALALAVHAAGQAVAPPPAADSVNVCLPETGSRSWCGDGGPATAAKLAGPSDVAVAKDGSLLIADTLNNVIRRVRPNSIVSIAGTGEQGSVVERRAAERVGFNAPRGVASVRDGGVLVADTGNDAVRLISADGMVTMLVAGSGPIRADLESPGDVTTLPDGDFLIADTGNNRVLRVSPSGSVRPLAGTERAGYTGDGGPAVTARLRRPTQLFAAPDGTVLIADTGNGAVRRVLPSGVIESVTSGLTAPGGVVGMPDGAVVVATAAGLLRVEPDGTRVRIAGGPRRGYNGNSGQALALRFDTIAQIARKTDGRIVFAEQGSDRIRALGSDGGSIDTVAGSGEPIAIAEPEIAPRQPPAALFGSGSAGAAPATQSAKPPKCASYNPRFATFNLVPATSDRLQRKARRRIGFRFRTSRQARVVIELRKSGRRVAMQTQRRVAIKPRRKSRRITVTLKGGKVRGKYVVWLWGRNSGKNKVLRCDSRRVRIK